MTSSEFELRHGEWSKIIHWELSSKETPESRLSKCKDPKMKMVLERVTGEGKTDLSETKRTVGKVGKYWVDMV